jgi:hypothetical protein
MACRPTWPPLVLHMVRRWLLRTEVGSIDFSNLEESNKLNIPSRD